MRLCLPYLREVRHIIVGEGRVIPPLPSTPFLGAENRFATCMQHMDILIALNDKMPRNKNQTMIIFIKFLKSMLKNVIHKAWHFLWKHALKILLTLSKKTPGSISIAVRARLAKFLMFAYLLLLVPCIASSLIFFPIFRVPLKDKQKKEKERKFVSPFSKLSSL